MGERAHFYTYLTHVCHEDWNRFSRTMQLRWTNGIYAVNLGDFVKDLDDFNAHLKELVISFQQLHQQR